MPSTSSEHRTTSSSRASLSPRDLERLHDEAVQLEQAGILERHEIENIRWRIARIAKGKPELAAYFELIADTDRHVVDLTNNPLRQQWLEDAYEDLKNADLFGNELWEVKDKVFPRECAQVDPSFLVSDLALSVRARNCLEEQAIETVNGLLRRTEEELLGMRNFGATCLAEVRKALFDTFQLKLPVK